MTRSFVKCGCMPLDSVETSTSFSETFAKNEMAAHRKTIK